MLASLWLSSPVVGIKKKKERIEEGREKILFRII